MHSLMPEPINILIIEDDLYYNNLLARKIKNYTYKSAPDKRYVITIDQVYDPKEFLRVIHEAKDIRRTIAFIDYRLGKGFTGLDLSEKLVERNEHIKIVIMSQSEKIINGLEGLEQQKSIYTKLVKHEYTPDICCIIIENYLKNLV